MIIWQILIFAFSAFGLVYSGSWVVKCLVRIAQFLKWKEFIVSSVLMAFTTSMPEFFIAITSAIDENPEISFGDVIGSNIIALTLVIGIGAFLAKGIKFEGKIMQKSSLYAALIALAPFVLIIDGYFSRWNGVLLIIIFIAYFRSLLVEQERFSKALEDSIKRNFTHFKIFLKDIVTFIIATIFLLISAQGIIFSSTSIAEEFEISFVMIGILLVAIGTSLPEVIFGIKSVLMGHKEMILGDVIGSVVINSTLVLGITALIHPFYIPDISPYLLGAIFTVISALCFFIFLRTSETISKREAVFLIFIYIVFIAFEIGGEI